MSLDEVRLVAHALEEFLQFVLGDAGEETRVSDLVAVQVKDGQHTAIAGGVEELVAVPARGEWSGLGFAVADDAGDDQVRVVEGGSVSVAQGVAQFAAFVDATGSLGGDVAGDAARKAKLLEELFHPRRVLADIRVHLAIGAFEVRMGDQGRTTVAGADDVDHVLVIFLDDPVEMNAEHVQAGRRTPMAEQPWLDVFALERFVQERVVEEVDLTDRQVIGGSPVGVHLPQFVGGERGCRSLATVLGRAFHVGTCSFHVSFLL